VFCRKAVEVPYDELSLWKVFCWRGKLVSCLSEISTDTGADCRGAAALEGQGFSCRRQLGCFSLPHGRGRRGLIVTEEKTDRSRLCNDLSVCKIRRM
jgi:hypothetical protein